MKSSYGEKLRSPMWQRKRLEILNRDGFKCRLCGDKETPLHVHHLRYEKGRDPWDYNEGSLLTVCENCHEELHQVKFGESILESLIAGGANLDDLYSIHLSLEGALNDGPEPMRLTSFQWQTFADSSYWLLKATQTNTPPEVINKMLGGLCE